MRYNQGNNNHIDHVYILMPIYGITLVFGRVYMITKSHHELRLLKLLRKYSWVAFG